MRLSAIIPAYNEAARLPRTLAALNGYLLKQAYEFEIIVVNDGSTDDTADAIRPAAARIKNFRLVDNENNKGKGCAVRQGMLAAQGDYRIYLDADNAISIEQIENFWPYLEQGFDLVIGSIEVKGARTGLPAAWYRHFLGKLSKYIIRHTVLPTIRDSQRAFKLMPGPVAKEIFSRQTLSGWGFDIEILVIARGLGYKIKELPVAWLNSSDSRVKFRDYFKTWRELQKIRRNMRANKYG